MAEILCVSARLGCNPALRYWWPGQTRPPSKDTDDDVVVVTTNPRHFSRFVDARAWQEIAP